MSSVGYHEPVGELSAETRDMHRAIVSLMEELEAIDWYNQRADACKDAGLKAILRHNRDEEKEHAAMSYIEESLSAGEKIEGLFKLHWVDWLWFWLWVVLAIPTLGITLLLALYEFLKLKYQEQGVTNKRVILKKGIISRKTEEMRLKSIETVEIDQGVFGRMLGFGTVKLTGKGVSDFLLKDIADPLAVKRTIESVGSPID